MFRSKGNKRFSQDGQGTTGLPVQQSDYFGVKCLYPFRSPITAQSLHHFVNRMANNGRKEQRPGARPWKDLTTGIATVSVRRLFARALASW
jgi:hypothetical protein